MSGGLWCFRAVTIIGTDHTPTVTSGDRASTKLPQFKAINTLLGNVKTALSGAYLAFDFAKYAHRYLAEAQYRFNRRFNLASILARLQRRMSFLGLIKRVAHTYRYYLTRLGRAAIDPAYSITQFALVPATAFAK